VVDLVVSGGNLAGHLDVDVDQCPQHALDLVCRELAQLCPVDVPLQRGFGASSRACMATDEPDDGGDGLLGDPPTRVRGRIGLFPTVPKVGGERDQPVPRVLTIG
jgi:hypothetical protein